MAILKNLLVNGSARFLNTLYANDLTVSGTTTFAGINASSLTVSGNATVNGTTTLKGTKLTGTLTIVNTASSNADTVGLVVGGDGTGNRTRVMSDGLQAVNSDGVKQLYLNYWGGVVSLGSGNQITANNGTFTTPTLNATKSTINNLYVPNELRAVNYNIETVSHLGGAFFVAPSIEVPAGNNVSITAISGNTITATISDNSITTTAFSPTWWCANSLVKIAGSIAGIPIGTCDGTLTSALVAGRVVVQFTYTGQSEKPLSVANSQASSGLSVTLTTIGGTKPIGIYMTALGQNGWADSTALNKTAISIYGGTTDGAIPDSTNPVVRIGNLAGLPTVNNIQPVGWGIYTNHGYFDGVIVSNEGKIGGWTLGSEKIYSGNHDTWSHASNGLFLGTTRIAGGNGGTWYLDQAGTGKIGRWTFASNGELSTTVSNNTAGMGNGTYAFWAGAASSSAANAPFRVGYDGTLNATSATISGEITATSGTIGGASITNGVLQVTDANISGEISANHINASGLTIGQSQVTNLTTDLNSKASTTSVNNLKAVYGTSSTAATTATKVVTCSNFALYTGALITVRFSAANTVDGLKLNVNGTGAKDVFLHGVLTKVGNSLLWGAKALVTFRYDGTRFLVMDEPSSWYGTCTTADSTAAKVASQYNTNQGCVIMPGTKVIIAMTNANTASNTTLNFNGTGAKGVYADNANPTVANGKGWPAGSTVEFVFDGQYWYIGNTAAAKTATNYIVADSNGLMVADMSNGVQTPTTATSKNVLIDDDSVDIRNGQTVLATFGNTVRIGRVDQGHVDIDATSMYLRGYNNIKVFRVGEASVWTPSAGDLSDLSTYTCTSSDVGRTDPLRFEVTDQAIHYIRVLYNGSELYGDGIVPIESEESSTGYVQNFVVISPQDVNDGAGFAEGDVVKVGTLLQTGLYLGSTVNDEIAPGAISHGLSNTVTGSNAYAAGNRCVASGNSAHAEGIPLLDTESGELTYVTASGKASHAEGVGSTASAQASHSEGTGSKASGRSSHAEGSSEASGHTSHSEGYDSKALGAVSHASGYGVIAKGACQTAIGRYNIASGEETVVDHTKPFFIIGNGTDETNRSNALTVDGNGGIEMDLDVDSSASSSTAATSGTDKDLFNAIQNLGWVSNVID